MADLCFIILPNGEGLPVPAYATEGAAGMDICAAESVLLLERQSRKVSTGLSVIIPDGYELQVRPRSGLAANSGITVLNSPGTIDSDYRGEIKVILVNHSGSPRTISRGDRIAQLVMAPVHRPTIREINPADAIPTKRGTGGFGSTGT